MVTPGSHIPGLKEVLRDYEVKARSPMREHRERNSLPLRPRSMDIGPTRQVSPPARQRPHARSSPEPRVIGEIYEHRHRHSPAPRRPSSIELIRAPRVSVSPSGRQRARRRPSPESGVIVERLQLRRRHRESSAERRHTLPPQYEHRDFIEHRARSPYPQ